MTNRISKHLKRTSCERPQSPISVVLDAAAALNGLRLSLPEDHPLRPPLREIVSGLKSVMEHIWSEEEAQQ